jgi:predicted dithiol-disulfide oxidoreductase (DUF899 family)
MTKALTQHATGTSEEWLDRAPKGRGDGDGMWFRRHDQYPGA